MPENNMPHDALQNTQTTLATLQETAPLAARDVNIIAVSKRQPEERVDAMLRAGHRSFGENRLQEAVQRWQHKKTDYPDLTLHYLGPLQTNKADEVVAFFDSIHSLDRPKLAHSLAKSMAKHQRRIPCFVQVNTGKEPQKAGILPDDLADFIALCRDELQLPVIGLMCLPPANANPAPHFAWLREQARHHNLPRLSMGMSNDWPAAIRMGATDIRLGTALFGPRIDDNHSE
jgi:hypothetical protein